MVLVELPVVMELLVVAMETLEQQIGQATVIPLARAGRHADYDATGECAEHPSQQSAEAFAPDDHGHPECRQIHAV